MTKQKIFSGNLQIKKMALASALATLVAACGGSDVPAPAPAPAPVVQVPTPPPTQIPTNIDFVGQYLIPQLQNTYGNIELLDPVTAVSTIPGNNFTLTLPPGTYTWAQVYTQFVVPAVQSCSCLVQGTQGTGASVWASINYNDFYFFLGGANAAGYNPFYQARVRFPQRGGYMSHFMAVYNALVSLNFSYYSAYYYGIVGVNGSWVNGTWPMMPQQSGFSGGLTLGYNNQSGFQFNLGGVLGF